MTLLFEVEDRNGKLIRLTTEQWAHINKEHPDVSNWQELRDVLIRPTAIVSSDRDPVKVKWFYRLNKKEKLYLFVSVKYLNGEGFIITAYYTRKIK